MVVNLLLARYFGSIPIMWKISLLFVSLLLFITPQFSMAQGNDCITLKSPAHSFLTENSSFAELSWKVSVVNSCAEAFETTVTYKVFNIDGFELDDDFAFNVIVPGQSTVLVREIMLVDPPTEVDQISYSTVSFTTRNYQPSLAEQCLMIGGTDSRNLEENSVFLEIIWRVEVINECNEKFDTTVFFEVYDAAGFLLDDTLEVAVYAPALGTGIARERLLLDSELINRYMNVSSRLSNQDTVNAPEFLETGRRLQSPPSAFDASTGILTTPADVEDYGLYNVELTLISSIPEIDFKLNENVLVNVASLPDGSSKYFGRDASLRIPSLEIANFPGISSLENVVLKLTDPTELVFTLKSYVETGFPNATNLVDGASNCLRMGNLNIMELARNSTFAELSWKVDVTNNCSDDFDSTLYFYVHDGNDLVLEYDIESDLDTLANSTQSITGQMLISPPELVADIAKISARLRVR